MEFLVEASVVVTVVALVLLTEELFVAGVFELEGAVVSSLVVAVGVLEELSFF